MARAMGIDFGEKRIGIALSDPGGRIAVELPTLARTDDRSAVREIAEIARREEVELLIVGEPRGLDGRRGEAALRAASFARKLVAATGLELRMIDEALTSHEAERQLREAGVDPRKHPERIDALAARMLLQEALDDRERES
jgi:putative Holliday junction resolvase